MKTHKWKDVQVKHFTPEQIKASKDKANIEYEKLVLAEKSKLKGKGERIVVVNKQEWRYKIGRQFVRLISPTGKNLSFPITNIHPDWNECKCAEGKSPITPSMVVEQIKQILAGDNSWVLVSKTITEIVKKNKLKV
jgi:hypothetical protein